MNSVKPTYRKEFLFNEDDIKNLSNIKKEYNFPKDIDAVRFALNFTVPIRSLDDIDKRDLLRGKKSIKTEKPAQSVNGGITVKPKHGIYQEKNGYFFSPEFPYKMKEKIWNLKTYCPFHTSSYVSQCGCLQKGIVIEDHEE